MSAGAVTPQLACLGMGFWGEGFKIDALEIC